MRMSYYAEEIRCELSVHQVSAELEAYAKREEKMSRKTGIISTAAGWRSDDFGSDYCAESSFDAIFDAYNDYVSTKIACGMYGDNKYWY